jgi:hypothetical protein
MPTVKSGQQTLIDFTFTNAAGKSGKDGAEAGYHADLAWHTTRN